MDRKRAAIELFESMHIFRRVFKGVRGSQGQHHNQDMVLHFISHHNGNSMKFYSDKMHIAKSNFTKIIDSLIEEGFLIREYDIKDRRKIKLVITDKGREKVSKDHEAMIYKIEEKLTRLDDDDINILFESLRNLDLIATKLNSEDKKNV